MTAPRAPELELAAPVSRVATRVFGLVIRGAPIEHRIETESFTHGVTVGFSGVFFSYAVIPEDKGLVLLPRLSLIARSGQTVVLSEDRIGPLPADTVLVDFAATDEGQEVQLMTILRGPSRPRRMGLPGGGAFGLPGGRGRAVGGVAGPAAHGPAPLGVRVRNCAG